MIFRKAGERFAGQVRDNSIPNPYPTPTPTPTPNPNLQVLAVVVAQVIVRDDRGRLDAGGHLVVK